ncbi:MAG: hypothetical protein WBV43_10870 [Pseudolabrys sp.]|jgi:uncharacterized protein YdcH (DUF465 family)
MPGISLKIHEREVESARAKLTEDLAVLCSARTFATFTDDLKQEALETKDAVWEKLKARAAANPAAMLAIAAGLGWRLMNRPPIASALIGLGLFSLWRTPGAPLDKRSSFLQQSAQSLKTQGEDFATAAGGMAADLAAQAKDTVSTQGAEAWEAAKVKVQEWNESAGARLDDARSKAKTASDSVVEGLRRQQHDLRDEIAVVTAAAKGSLRDEGTRNTVLVGIAGVAIAAALGIACQKRISESTEA